MRKDEINQIKIVVVACTVGDWGEWSECTPRAASLTGHKPTSFPLPETYMEDRGRVMMGISREAKESHFAEVDRCLASGECPELAMRPSAGAAKCSNGTCLYNLLLMTYSNRSAAEYYQSACIKRCISREGNVISGLCLQIINYHRMIKINNKLGGQH